MSNNKRTNNPSQAGPQVDPQVDTQTPEVATIQALPKTPLRTKARNWFSDHPRITGIAIGAAVSPVFLYLAGKAANKDSDKVDTGDMSLDEIDNLLDDLDKKLSTMESDAQG